MAVQGAQPKPKDEEISNLSKYERTKKHLDAQPKVQVMLERREGEFPELDFNINGVHYKIVRGVATEVPQQVAEMLYERMAAEGKMTQLSKEMVDKMSQIKM